MVTGKATEMCRPGGGFEARGMHPRRELEELGVWWYGKPLQGGHRALPILVLLLLLSFRSVLATCLDRIVRQRGNRRLGHTLRLLYKKTLLSWSAGLSICSQFTLFVCPEWSLSGDSVAWIFHLVAEWPWTYYYPCEPKLLTVMLGLERRLSHHECIPLL